MRTVVRLLAAVALCTTATWAGSVGSAADPGSGARWDGSAHRKAAAQETTTTAGVDGDVSSAAVSTFTDTQGDVSPQYFCESDITGFTADYRFDLLTVSLTTLCPSDPAMQWYPGATGFEWWFDLNGDNVDDYAVAMWGEPGVARAGVFDVRGADPVFLCGASPSWDRNRTYSVAFHPTCIGDPSSVRVQAFTIWDEAPYAPTCVCPFDVAPNGFGFSPPVIRTYPVPVGDGPGVASADDGLVDVFARGQDNALWTRHRADNGTWGGWSSLGGIITGTPTAASAATGELDVFVRGQDNALWTQHHDGTSWSGWSSLGGILTTPPAVVSSAPNTLDVFVAGNDRALYVRHFANDKWGGWVSLGGVISATPAAVSSSAGTIDVFARGQDNALYTQRHNGNSWSGWGWLGGIITSAPSAASAGEGSIDVFARGQDEALWSQSSFNGAWSGWVGLGGVLASPPAAVSAAPGTLDVFIRGQDFALWTMHREGIWGPWMSLGGIIR